jgi:hypothetical protein
LRWRDKAVRSLEEDLERRKKKEAEEREAERKRAEEERKRKEEELARKRKAEEERKRKEKENAGVLSNMCACLNRPKDNYLNQTPREEYPGSPPDSQRDR